MNRAPPPVPMIEELAAGYVPAFDPALLSAGEGGLLRPAILALELVWLTLFALVPGAPDPTARAVKELADEDKNPAAVGDSPLLQELVKEWPQ
jgi:hypothetical protein